MKISELFPDVVTEDTEYEFKALLKQDNPVKWAKTIVGYANDQGGIIFVGVSNDGEAFGLDLNEIDQTKNLVARVNDRNIFPHVKISYMMRSVDETADHFVLGMKVLPADIGRVISTKLYTSEEMVILHLQHQKTLFHYPKDVMVWTMKQPRCAIERKSGQII